MTRYFYLLVFLNMISNVILFVPRILIDHRFDGAVISIPIGTMISILLLFLFTKAMLCFPGKGLPEILQENTPAWFQKSFIFLLSLNFLVAGGFGQAAYASIIKRFISPDVSTGSILLLFLILVSSLSMMRSRSIVYLLEILFVINIPFIAFITLKAYGSDEISWHAIQEVATYINEPPNLSSLSAATYTFSGYANLVIFNRLFKEKFQPKYFWAIACIGFLNLCTTFFVPIGFQGTQAVGDYIYPWIATADSLRMEFGFVERMLFFFLVLYISISIISSIVHWHVGLELIKSLFSQSKTESKQWFIAPYQPNWSKWRPLIIVGIFSATTYIFDYYFNHKQFFVFGESWIRIRLLAEVILVGLILVLVRRGKKK